MSLSNFNLTSPSSHIDTNSSTTFPPYAIALVVVVAVVSLGLLIAIVYYCRIKDNREQLMRESPEREPEQLRDEQVRHRHPVQIPDIPTILAANINSKPSPSIFSRGNFVLEVLDDVKKEQNKVEPNTEGTMDNECNVMTKAPHSPSDPDAIVSNFSEGPDSSMKRPRIGTIGGLRVREHSQAGASIAALRGSLSSGQESSFYDGIDVAASTEFTIYEDRVDMEDCIETEIVKEDEYILSIKNENYCLDFDRENSEEEIKRQPSGAVKQLPCMAKSRCTSALSEQRVSLNITPTSAQEENSPCMAVNNPLSASNPPLHTTVSITILPTYENVLFMSQPSPDLFNPQIYNTPISAPEKTSSHDKLCSKDEIDSECEPVKDEFAAPCDILAHDAEENHNEEASKQPDMTNLTGKDLRECSSALVEENDSILSNLNTSCDESDGENFDGAGVITPSEQITVNIVNTSGYCDELESDNQASFLSTSTPALPYLKVSMNTSMSDSEAAVSVSQLILRSDAKLPSTPLSHNSDYTPVCDSRKMGSSIELE